MKASLLLKEILEKKSRTNDEFIVEARKVGVRRSNFYTQLKKLLEKGEIKYISNILTGEKTWMLVEDVDKVSLNDIELCMNQIESNNKNLRDIGVKEFVYLCQTKVVTHDPRVKLFFKKIFNDDSFKDVHEKLLLAFKYVIARTKMDGNDEIINSLIKENYEIIKKFAKANLIKWKEKGFDNDSIRMKKKALYFLSFFKDKEVINIILKLIEEISPEEYSKFKAEILDIFRLYLSEYGNEIKRGLYTIATNEKYNKDEKIIDRAINLLYDLADRSQITYYS